MYGGLVWVVAGVENFKICGIWFCRIFYPGRVFAQQLVAMVLRRQLFVTGDDRIPSIFHDPAGFVVATISPSEMDDWIGFLTYYILSDTNLPISLWIPALAGYEQRTLLGTVYAI
ncbi:MAG: hypothetical protein COW63_14950 [Bacteroidetes bacterium CG18_big_fil_WC_8_21_14_2_50_41_14]|nr:MAG: hypothetical protein COW63_14950 [Bacteroidetes bacterium CG18_big_fil_WC_8_21_14_2_50_41_14]PJB55135.1 MAG: hypothetical protein CO098_17920 [Bacteroidetes bacterium CG_4_9_14_3_um_filter_41_19]